ncbi:MAG: alpha/beta hydrolase [Anaerolineae bacterium]|nr:alpha/beta hydrolase [Anaerolineae bacterium]
MKNMRTYGNSPYRVALIHGGPGAGGEMAPVARALAPEWSVLEPIQTALTLVGQVDELRDVLAKYGEPPLTLVGYSWGAWLIFLTAARYPALVKKLILVSSGPFEASYVRQLEATRQRRLSEAENAEFAGIVHRLGDAAGGDKDALLERLGALVSKTDNHTPCEDDLRETDHVPVSGDIFQGVWNEAAGMRESGALLRLGQHIQCPVTAIHGDYDPHPAEGVRQPLARVITDFRFVLIPQCGHTPWAERHAQDEFYRVLREELRV